jgi:hypothetical protein
MVVAAMMGLAAGLCVVGCSRSEPLPESTWEFAAETPGKTAKPDVPNDWQTKDAGDTGWTDKSSTSSSSSEDRSTTSSSSGKTPKPKPSTWVYVVAEKRGEEVCWCSFEHPYEMTQRVAELQKEAKDTNKANADLLAEIRGLRKREKELKSALLRQTDPEKKKDLQSQLDYTQLLISTKEDASKPVVIWKAEGKLDPRHLDSFVLRMQHEAGVLNVRSVKAAELPGRPAVKSGKTSKPPAEDEEDR